jgi:ABC-type sugar transport system substrate-binding protein
VRLRTNRPLLIVAGVTAAAVLTACGSSGSSTGGQAAKSSSHSKPKISFVYQVRVPAVEIAGYGGETAASQLGFSVNAVGPTAYDVIKQQTMFNSESVAGAQGIATVVLEPTAWQRTISAAVTKGIKVVDFGVYTGPFEGAKTPIYVGPDDHAYGRALSALLIKALGPNAHGQVVITSCAPSVQEQQLRVTGVRQALAAQEPGVTLVGPVVQTDDATQGVLDAQRIVLAHPKALAFVGLCSTAPAAFAKVKKDTNAKWIITGGELDPGNLQGIKQGLIVGVVDASLWLQGYISARLLYEQIAHPGSVPTTGWLDSGVETVNSANVDQVIQRQASLASQATAYLPIVNKIFTNLKANIKPLLASQN